MRHKSNLKHKIFNANGPGEGEVKDCTVHGALGSRAPSLRQLPQQKLLPTSFVLERSAWQQDPRKEKDWCTPNYGLSEKLLQFERRFPKKTR